MSQGVQHDLAFLHTAQAHVERFSQLVEEARPLLRVRHEVRPDLLSLAQDIGNTDPLLQAQVHAAMRDAASSGARLVVCTCSTIGDIAEQFDLQANFACQRIDRAMADTAVSAGPRILLVVALASTVAASTQLLRQSAKRLGKEIHLTTLEVSGAWAHFLAQDSSAYADTIAQSIRSHEKDADVIVLAQASMQSVAAQLFDLKKPVLASPHLGVERALQLFP